MKYLRSGLQASYTFKTILLSRINYLCLIQKKTNWGKKKKKGGGEACPTSI